MPNYFMKKKVPNLPSWLSGMKDQNIVSDLSKMKPFIFACCRLKIMHNSLVIPPEDPKAVIIRKKNSLLLTDGFYIIQCNEVNEKLLELLTCRNKMRSRDVCFWLVKLDEYSFELNSGLNNFSLTIKELLILKEMHCLENFFARVPHIMSCVAIKDNLETLRSIISEKNDETQNVATSTQNCSCTECPSLSSSEEEKLATHNNNQMVSIPTEITIPGVFSVDACVQDNAENLASSISVALDWVPVTQEEDANRSLSSVEDFADALSQTKTADPAPFYSPVADMNVVEPGMPDIPSQPDIDPEQMPKERNSTNITLGEETLNGLLQSLSPDFHNRVSSTPPQEQENLSFSSINFSPLFTQVDENKSPLSVYRSPLRQLSNKIENDVSRKVLSKLDSWFSSLPPVEKRRGIYVKPSFCGNFSVQVDFTENKIENLAVNQQESPIVSEPQLSLEPRCGIWHQNAMSTLANLHLPGQDSTYSREFMDLVFL